ncbi:MAG: hydrogenase expression/formation protein HypE [Candidatus Bathyarchaeota archaeon]|nr:MAG: hydrogenase expression/formation protein HypE [Candidatus Bathyarchaeota archaeon]
MRDKHVTMAHGAGGSVMAKMVSDFVIPILGGYECEVGLDALDDASVIGDLVLKSDSHAVQPIFFPGGDIGRLAVAGTVNDIAVLGAQPLALACGLILEEGLAFEDLRRVLTSVRSACEEADVSVITGDTKVVEKECLGGLVINMSGIGRGDEALEHNIKIARQYRKTLDTKWILDKNLREGDKIILSGTVGDHGVAIMSTQENIGLRNEVRSDVKPLNHMIGKILKVGGIVSMKDPTRGGLANSLNEWREKSHVGIQIQESHIPIRNDVRAACEILGIDPLEVGNEGKVIIGVVKEQAEEVLEELRSTDEGREAEIIGEATGEFNLVTMKTIVGGKRIITTPIGDPVPRIC